MKWTMALLALAMTGCASVQDIEHSPATLSVISGKSPNEYAHCFMSKIGDSREPPLLENRKDGVRLIVAQKLLDDEPAAIVDIEKRSNGSSIKVHERLNNLPIRNGDVRDAAEHCISG